MKKTPKSDPFFAFANLDNDEMQLATGALLIAQSEYPELDIEACLHELDKMADTVRERIQGTTLPEQHIAALNRYLFEEKGFTRNIDNYYALGNNFRQGTHYLKVGACASQRLRFSQRVHRLIVAPQ